MSEDNKADIEFLEHQLEELQRIHPYLEELEPDDSNAKDGQPETSDEAERCARLADRYKLDGSIFRNLIPPSFDARPDVRAMLRLARKQMEMIPRIIAAIETKPAEKLEEPDTKNTATHSDGFRSVNWYGELYTFTPKQALCIECLWRNWGKGTPAVAERFVLEDAKSNQLRLINVFENGKHPAWKVMIKSGQRKGSVQLAGPPS